MILGSDVEAEALVVLMPARSHALIIRLHIIVFLMNLLLRAGWRCTPLDSIFGVLRLNLLLLLQSPPSIFNLILNSVQFLFFFILLLFSAYLRHLFPILLHLDIAPGIARIRLIRQSDIQIIPRIFKIKVVVQIQPSKRINLRLIRIIYPRYSLTGPLIWAAVFIWPFVLLLPLLCCRIQLVFQLLLLFKKFFHHVGQLIYLLIFLIHHSEIFTFQRILIHRRPIPLRINLDFLPIKIVLEIIIIVLLLAIPKIVIIILRKLQITSPCFRGELLIALLHQSLQALLLLISVLLKRRIIFILRRHRAGGLWHVARPPRRNIDPLALQALAGVLHAIFHRIPLIATLLLRQHMQVFWQVLFADVRADDADGVLICSIRRLPGAIQRASMLRPRPLARHQIRIQRQAILLLNFQGAFWIRGAALRLCHAFGDGHLLHLIPHPLVIFQVVLPALLLLNIPNPLFLLNLLLQGFPHCNLLLFSFRIENRLLIPPLRQNIALPLQLQINSIFEDFSAGFHIWEVLLRPRRIKLLIIRLLLPRRWLWPIDIKRLIIWIERLLLRHLRASRHAPLKLVTLITTTGIAGIAVIYFVRVGIRHLATRRTTLPNIQPLRLPILLLFPDKISLFYLPLQLYLVLFLLAFFLLQP